jgi:hypothetical protein
MGHLESHSAMTRSLLAAFADSAGLGLTKNLLDQMRTAQMVASTAAWGSLVTRELSYLQTVDFSGLRSTVAYLSAAVARRLDLAASSPAALRFGRMSAVDAAAFGFRVRGNAGLLTSISGGLRTFGAAELKSGELEPVAFGTLSATGVAGFVAPASAELDVDLSALDLEVHAAGMELIRREQPELVRKLDGALFAIRSGSPDGPSQASHSLQELLDRLLRTVANEREALEWCHEHYRKNGVYVRGDGSQALTRAGKVMFIATRNGIPMEVAEALAKIVTCSSQILQRGKHDDAPARLIANMILVIEGCAGAIIAMSLKRPE